MAIHCKAGGEARSIELTTKVKNDALMATAKAEADATKTRADAERYRIDTACRFAGATSTSKPPINAFATLANHLTNLVVADSKKWQRWPITGWQVV